MINIPKGTKDALPTDIRKWHYIERKIRETAAVFGLKEIRTPTFEHTELFLRGVGDTTDIVNKEMYTFTDKGGRSITLKPEGTAGVARAYIENGLHDLPQPLKLYYVTPVFRYERPQAGRLREHHQFGVEIFGSTSPYADAEVIMIAKTLLEKIGITELELNLNSIGCSECRKDYNKALIGYFESVIDGMCPVCKDRLYKNPLRILDCKEAECAKINLNAPKTIDYLCGDCKNHHEELKKILESLGVNYRINTQIVRGLDYYTGTVFEFISKSIGAQGTVTGGGRYNNLIEEVGGKPTPAVGFGMGIERLIMTAESLNLPLGEDDKPDIYIASASAAQNLTVYNVVMSLRKKGFSAETDLTGRSLKAQMKYADKIKAKFSAVIGENECQSGKIVVKNMYDGTQTECGTDNISEILSEEKKK